MAGSCILTGVIQLLSNFSEGAFSGGSSKPCCISLCRAVEISSDLSLGMIRNCISLLSSGVVTIN